MPVTFPEGQAWGRAEWSLIVPACRGLRNLLAALQSAGVPSEIRLYKERVWHKFDPIVSMLLSGKCCAGVPVLAWLWLSEISPIAPKRECEMLAWGRGAVEFQPCAALKHSTAIWR